MAREFQKRDLNFRASVNDEGIFEGYLSTYDDVDSYGTYFMPGAWDRSIERFNSGEVIPVLWSHDRSKPIGKFTELKSDDKGLWGRGKLTLEDPQAKIAYAHMKDGSVMGLSVGFEMDYDNVIYNRLLDALGIAEADLFECSVVVFPANTNAKITNFKSQNHDHGENKMEGSIAETIEKMNAAIENLRTAQTAQNDAEISKRDAEISDLKKQIAQLSNPITGTAQTEDPSKQYEKDFHTYLKTGTALNLRAAGSEGTNANGGYICPDGLDKRVVELLTPRSTIRRNATIIQALLLLASYTHSHSIHRISLPIPGITSRKDLHVTWQFHSLIKKKQHSYLAMAPINLTVFWPHSVKLKTTHRELGTNCNRLILNLQQVLPSIHCMQSKTV